MSRHKELFKNQLGTLERIGVQKRIIEVLKRKELGVLERMDGVGAVSSEVPFLPVLEHAGLIEHPLVEVLRLIGGWSPRKSVKEIFKYGQITPSGTPYYIFDIVLSNEKRVFDYFPLTIAEVIALSLHLGGGFPADNTKVVAAGSRWGSTGCVPVLIGGEGPPTLFPEEIGELDSDLVIWPHCRSRW